MEVKNKVQLITYPGSLGRNLKDLKYILHTCFAGAFKGGIHILPPFPSSGDRGFAPLTYMEIDPAFGSWEDIRSLGNDFDIMLDLMVNHISRQSACFQDFLKKGRRSGYAELFIPVDSIWPDGIPSRDEIEKLFLRREEPFSTYSIESTGEEITLWTTFGKENPSEQVDLNINSPSARFLFRDILKYFGRQNIKYVRLDAAAYIIKKAGTSCFFIEPEIYEFLEYLKSIADPLGMILLPEIHAPYDAQRRLAEHGFWIYDFVLPFTILHALLNKSCVRLRAYLAIRSPNQFTMLDCHDGIPVKPDLDGIFDSSDAAKTVDVCLKRGANLSRIFSPKYRGDDGFDVHQIRCSFYSALNCDDNAYLTARAIQFFTPGIPQVYYVGLLAGENAPVSKESSRDGREINRRNYDVEGIRKIVKKDVITRLLKLIAFRNDHPAFDGVFSLEACPDAELRMAWQKEAAFCRLEVDLNRYMSIISYTNIDGKTIEYIV